MAYSKVGDRLCEMGRFGQKTGNGWYDYVAGQREPVVAPPVIAMIERNRKDIGSNCNNISNNKCIANNYRNFKCLYWINNATYRFWNSQCS